MKSTLFRYGGFRLRSGLQTSWKIDCDALTKRDWEALAWMARLLLEPYSRVVDCGGASKPFAEALRRIITIPGKTLIADDVLTTGSTMDSMRHKIGKEDGEECIGIVAFARGRCPAWITPLFEWKGPP